MSFAPIEVNWIEEKFSTTQIENIKRIALNDFKINLNIEFDDYIPAKAKGFNEKHLTAALIAMQNLKNDNFGEINEYVSRLLRGKTSNLSESRSIVMRYILFLRYSQSQK